MDVLMATNPSFRNLRWAPGVWVLLALAWLLLTLPVAAVADEPVATITHATGTTHLRLPDGSLRLASVGTELVEGTIVTVEESSSVRIRFPDGAELVLKPGSRLRIDSLQFQPDEPDSDSLVFGLLKGGLRAVTGLVGRRSSPETFEGRTLVGTIGIRGTEFGMLLCEPGECDHLLTVLPPELRERIGSAGLFFEPTLGVIVFRNNAGEFELAVGEWGYAESMDHPPIIVRDGTPFPLRALLPLIASSESVGGFSAGLGFDPFAQCWLR
jgi:hypothetical protein